MQAAAKALIAVHNELLGGLTDTFPIEHPNASILSFDFSGVLQQVLANASASGLDITSRCYEITSAEELQPLAKPGLVCSDPQNHVWWDWSHPTSWVHEILGRSAAEELSGLVAEPMKIK